MYGSPGSPVKVLCQTLLQKTGITFCFIPQQHFFFHRIFKIFTIGDQIHILWISEFILLFICWIHWQQLCWSIRREIFCMLFCYLGTLMLIMKIISNSFHQVDTESSSTPSSHCLSAACNMHRFSPLFHGAAAHSDPGTKMAISPLLFQTWSAWKLVNLCQAYVYAFKWVSNLYLTLLANQAQRKKEDKVVSLYLPHSETSVWDCYFQRMRQKNSHSF